MPFMPTISRQLRQAFLLVAAGVLGGCSIEIDKPANNAVITLPATTKVAVTGNASYTGLKVMVDGVDFSSQMASTGSSSSEGDLALAAGPHTATASAELSCWYCSSGKTKSTDTKSFIVASGTHVCARTGGAPILTLPSTTITVGQQPGRKLIGLGLQNGKDALLIIVDDAPGLTPLQMQVELDIDPFNNVTWNKAIEAWDFCRSGSRVDLVEASMVSTGINVGIACAQLTQANDFRSGCTKTDTMLINQSTTSELWLRKPGFLGIWHDAEAIDASIWQAFGGRSVRFIWRAD